MVAMLVRLLLLKRFDLLLFLLEVFDLLFDLSVTYVCTISQAVQGALWRLCW